MEQIRKQDKTDLTTGNLFWKIPLFALPMAITTIFQLLYTTIDLYTVANFGGGTLSMTAIGSNSSLINLVINFFVAISVGSNVALANAKGAGDKKRAQRVLNTSFIISIILGVIVGIFGFFISPVILNWMDTPNSIVPLAIEYLKIYFLGIPFVMVYNFCAQMMRAMGDSKRPLYFLTISGIVNVAFDFLFVIAFHMDVEGVAWATIISEMVSAVLAVLWLTLNKKGYVYLIWSHIRFSRRALNEIIKVGIPAGVQALAFNIPNLLIQKALYTIDNYYIDGVFIPQEDIIAGSSSSSQVEGYVYAFIDALSVAAVSFVGQNYGAKKENNIKKIYWYTQFWNVVASLLCIVVTFTIPDLILSLFIKEGKGIIKANAINAGKQRLFMMVGTYVFDGIMAIDGQYLRGMKYSTAPALITLIGVTATRIIFIYTLFQLPEFHTIFWLYFTYPLSWIIIDIIYIPVILYIQKKAFNKLHIEQVNTEVNVIE